MVELILEAKVQADEPMQGHTRGQDLSPHLTVNMRLEVTI